MIAIDLASAVTRNESFGAGYFSLWMRAPAIAAGVLPGQFVMVGIEAGLRPYLRRPFSVADVDGDDVEILGKVVGPGTSALERAPAGTRVTLLGPLGNGFDLEGAASEARPVALVAGGIGVAPIVLAARRLRSAGVRATVYFGGRSGSDLVAADRLAALLGHDSVVLTTDDASRGIAGRVTAALEKDLDAGFAPARLWACGPEPMLVALEKVVRERKIPSQFAMEREMACGFGVCLGCVVPTGEAHWTTLCKEGPCLDPATIDWKRMHR